MTTKEVCEKTKESINAAAKWARLNNVNAERVGDTLRMQYNWTEEDVLKFINRNKRKGRKVIIYKKPPKDVKIKRNDFSADDVQMLVDLIKDHEE